MEFPEVGVHCAVPDCHQLDFLPIECACGQLFCREHFRPEQHNCPHPPPDAGDLMLPSCPLCGQLIQIGRGEDPNVRVERHIDAGCPKIRTGQQSKRCSMRGCRNVEPVPIVCPRCHMQFCTGHRHAEDHRCVALQRAPASASVRSQPARRPAASAAGQAAGQVAGQAAVPRRPGPTLGGKKATSPMATRLQEMRLKQRAVGDDRIPVERRMYFEVRARGCTTSPPVNQSSDVGELVTWTALFFDRRWTIGRALDDACKRLGVQNRNHIPGAPRTELLLAHSGVVLPLRVALDLLEPELRVGEQLLLETECA